MLNRLYISERDYQCVSLILNASIENGLIKSPDFDGDDVYENNLGCSWTIIADIDYIVQLFIKEFQLEKDFWCRFDNLKVKNSKRVWSGNTIITNCRQTHGIARKSHTSIMCGSRKFCQSVPSLTTLFVLEG